VGGARGLRAIVGARELTQPAPARSPRGRAASALLRGLAALPDSAGLALGARFGRAWAQLGLPRTRAARINLRIAFPEWSEEARERVLRESFANLGRGLVELAWLGRRDPDALAARVRIEGVQHVHAARERARGGGLIVLTAHFGSWEMFAAAMAAHGFPIVAVQRARDDAGLDEVLRERRREGGAGYLTRGNAALGALRALRSGQLLALPIDQNAHAGEGVQVPFFGRFASVAAGPVQLAMTTGAPVLPAFLHRDRSDPARHVARVRAPLELVPGEGDDALLENARRMTRAIEDEVRAAPEQWVWAHRRWRTQPPGEPSPAYAPTRARR
jgi:KDO2-lipid IV(A) lauroyltransferase